MHSLTVCVVVPCVWCVPECVVCPRVACVVRLSCDVNECVLFLMYVVFVGCASVGTTYQSVYPVLCV